MSNRILFLGAGRRLSMAERFIEKDFEVFSYEYDNQVPMKKLGNIIEGEKWDSPTLQEHLSKVIVDNKIEMVIPFYDEAVVKLASMTLPCLKLCSSHETANTCFDKRELEQKFQKCWFYPIPITGEECIEKPRFGFGSQGIKTRIYQSHFEQNWDMVYQEKIKGHEFSVDAYFNKEGKAVGISPRERLVVGNGEVMDSITVDVPILHKIVHYISANDMFMKGLQFTGPVCFQFMKTECCAYFLTEINCRFGGGVTLSMEAGLDCVQYIKDEYFLGKEVKENTAIIKPNIYMTRAYRDVFHG